MEPGADAYLTKPFSETELPSAISSRLARFQHLRLDYDLRAGGLGTFLDDAHAVRRKQDIYHEGDEPVCVYFVKSGRVKIVKTTDTGKELITGLYGPGEFFGYLALLEHTTHGDAATALDDAELVHITADDFRQLLLRSREVGQQLHPAGGRYPATLARPNQQRPQG